MRVVFWTHIAHTYLVPVHLFPAWYRPIFFFLISCLPGRLQQLIIFILIITWYHIFYGIPWALRHPASEGEPCTRYHFLRELVASNKIIVSHVKTTDQLADIFTKFLDYPKFKAILDKIINLDSWVTLQDHQHLHNHLYWAACVWYFILFCMRCMFNDLFLFRTLCSYIRISSLRYSRFLPDTLGWHEFLKYIFWIIGIIYTMLATLTTIATPRYSEGVGISDYVGHLLGPLFIDICYRLRFRLMLCYHYSYVLRLPMQRFCSARGVSDITL